MVAQGVGSLSRLLLVIGVTFVGLSFMLPSFVAVSLYVSPGVYEGEYFLATDDLYVHAYTDDGNYSFSLYCLDYEDVLLALESGTMNGTHPVLALENVDEYEGVLHFPSPGTHGIFMTHPYNKSIIIRCYGDVYPRPSLMNAGLMITIPMAAVQVAIVFLDRGYIRRKRNHRQS